MTMSNQPENGSTTPEEVRQSLLAEIDATKRAITELSDEKLEEVAGGGLLREFASCLTCGLIKPYKAIKDTGSDSGRLYNITYPKLNEKGIVLPPPRPGLKNK